MRITLSTEEILQAIGDGETEGHFSEKIHGIASLDRAEAGDLSFLGNEKYRKFLPESKASIILLPSQYEGTPRPEQLFIRMESPSRALALLCKRIETSLYPVPAWGIHPTAWIHPQAVISPNAYVGAFSHVGEGSVISDRVVLSEHVVIGRQVTMGDSCRVFPQTTIGDHCEFGERVIVQPGAVIGSDGYGYDYADGVHEKIAHIGKIVIENDVEIGANTTVDRARFSETRIGEGTKIDNLVQIAHNVVIGKHCLLVAQVGISGSTMIEDGVIIGGQAGVAGHLQIGEGAKIAAQAGITKNVEPGAYLKGNPALPYMLAQRVAVLQKKLPDLFKRFASEETSP